MPLASYTIILCIFILINKYKDIFESYINIEVSRGAAARSVTVKPTGCGFDPHSRR